MASPDHAKKRPAATPRHSNPPAGPSKGGAPGWLWLLTGIILGFGAAFLLHLWKSRDLEATAKMAVTPAPVADCKAAGNAATPSSAAPTSDEQAPHFDFYNILPNQKALPAPQAAASANKPVTPPPPASNNAAVPASSEPKKTAPSTAPGTEYLLQSGAFKSRPEADRRRAEIILLNLPAKIQVVHVKDDQTWYRVVVGPFFSNAAVSEARHSLNEKHIQSIPMKKG